MPFICHSNENFLCLCISLYDTNISQEISTGSFFCRWIFWAHNDCRATKKKTPYKCKQMHHMNHRPSHINAMSIYCKSASPAIPNVLLSTDTWLRSCMQRTHSHATQSVYKDAHAHMHATTNATQTHFNCYDRFLSFLSLSLLLAHFQNQPRIFGYNGRDSFFIYFFRLDFFFRLDRILNAAIRKTLYAIGRAFQIVQIQRSCCCCRRLTDTHTRQHSSVWEDVGRIECIIHTICVLCVY